MRRVGRPGNRAGEFGDRRRRCVVASVGRIRRALVFRARRRVVDLAEAAAWLNTDVPGVRSVIAEGDLASLTSEGRTYVDAGALEVRAALEMGAAPNG